jgi:PKD repeat protein
MAVLAILSLGIVIGTAITVPGSEGIPDIVQWMPGMLPYPFPMAPCHGLIAEYVIATLSAGFQADRRVGEVPFTVHFYDTSYGDHKAWFWTFGDGTYSTQQNPTHTYFEPGIYDVSLYIGNFLSYETSMANYRYMAKGQLTDLSWASNAVAIEYIQATPAGSGISEEIPVGWYPTPIQSVTMPSGRPGVIGTASYDGTLITIYNTTQYSEDAYSSSLMVSGAYNIYKSVPYNIAF